MRKLFVPALALLVLTYAMLAQAQRGGPPAMPPEPGSLPTHKFEKVVEGVYYATATGSMTIGSNGVVIVNDDDVMLVDPGVISAAAATTFLADVKTLTNKPVKYVVDTHYHYDHAFGNQVFGPDVTIIGHDTARRRLNGPGSLKERTVPDRTAPRPSRAASRC